jgi:hypothetical protein
MLVRKRLGKRSLGRLRSRWEDNKKMGLRKIGCYDGGWIELVQNCVHWRTLVLAVANILSCIPFRLSSISSHLWERILWYRMKAWWRCRACLSVSPCAHVTFETTESFWINFSTKSCRSNFILVRTGQKLLQFYRKMQSNLLSLSEKPHRTKSWVMTYTLQISFRRTTS